MNKDWMRMFVAVLLAAIFACAMPNALAEGSFKAVVTSKTMKVYAQAAPHNIIGKLSKGDTVTVKAYSGKAALISYNGNTGVARVSDMMAVAGEAQTSESENVETATASETANARTMVTTRNARVYRKASARSASAKVKAGTSIKVLDISGNVAKVMRGNVVGYMDARALGDPDAQKSADTATQATESVQKYDRKAVAASQECRVYARPDTSSSFVSVEKGARMVLLATKGNVAMVERDGKVGYMDKGNLIVEVSASTNDDSAVRTADGNATSVNLSGSNEEIVFKFLTKVMGYNTAAACGVMANIKYESGYKPTSGGDGGSSYGIVQWHAGRKTRLISWCGSNGYDYTTLEGQLYFLQYELKNRYPAVHKRLLAVSNTEQGAYDAGYDFCYNFEAPSNRASRSVTRGNYARQTLWNRYKA